MAPSCLYFEGYRNIEPRVKPEMGAPPRRILPRPDQVRGARFERGDDRRALGQAEIADGARRHGGDEREADVDADASGRRRRRDAPDRPPISTATRSASACASPRSWVTRIVVTRS